MIFFYSEQQTPDTLRQGRELGTKWHRGIQSIFTARRYVSAVWRAVVVSVHHQTKCST